MRVISIRKENAYTQIAIEFFQKSWSSVYPKIYEDSIVNCIASNSPFPQWYLLEKDGKVIGGAGLITNDFISRMDLYPWLCALYINEEYRGKGYSKLLIDTVKKDVKELGFENLYLCTDHKELYEKFGFKYIGDGYHPWKEASRIYEFVLTKDKKIMI